MDSESTIRVTKRTDRSLYMFMLQHLIKPFNVRIIKPRQATPPGSQQLQPPKNATRLCDVNERRVEYIYIYDLSLKRSSLSNNMNETKRRKRRLYYFCGGAWQMPPSTQHWAICAEIATRLSNTRVSIVSYPLAPNSPAPKAFPQLMKMYRRLLQDAEEAGEEMILAGDSAGGNVILSLALAALAEDEHSPCPSALMALSPSVDLGEQSPAMREVEKHDPILRLPFCANNAKLWRAEWAADDPRVTQLLADVSLLARRGVQVHGVTGRYDILCPNAVSFREKCAQARVKGEWLDWDKQMHVFPLAFKYKLPESVEAKEWIIDVLSRS